MLQQLLRTQMLCLWQLDHRGEFFFNCLHCCVFFNSISLKAILVLSEIISSEFRALFLLLFSNCVTFLLFLGYLIKLTI